VYFVQLGVCSQLKLYRDKKVVGVFVRFFVHRLSSTVLSAV
jgi:hypothetical protein